MILSGWFKLSSEQERGSTETNTDSIGTTSHSTNCSWNLWNGLVSWNLSCHSLCKNSDVLLTRSELRFGQWFWKFMHFINLCTWKTLSHYIKIIVMTSFMRMAFMLVFHQCTIYISAIKRMLFYYHVYLLVFFIATVYSLLLRCMLKSSLLRVEVKTLHSTYGNRAGDSQRSVKTRVSITL